MRRSAVHGAQLSLLATLAVLTACHLYRLERKLDPANADFLSRVSLIINRQERKVFLELPEAGKPAFIEKFWQRRDPDPDNEENEFREQYEERVEEAARLFRNEGKPGWLTDRGRILILFGPPDDRLTRPAGSGSGTACYEQWFYGNFPVLFIDRHCSGEYRLETNDLSSLRNVNLMYMHELNKAQDASLAITRPQGRLFDFNARLHAAARTPEQLAGSVDLRVRLEQLTFSTEGDLARCVLDVRLAFHDGQDRPVWESVSSPEVELKIADLNHGRREAFHSLRIPFAIDGRDKVSRLLPGKSSLQVTVTIRTDGRSLQKQIEVK
jgi:GWxTD domain-containing protein